MAEITARTAPPDVPTTNALDNVEDPDNPSSFDEKVDVYLSGARVCSLVNPPKGRGRITLMVELEGTEDGTKYIADDKEIPVWKCKRVGDMWRPGEPKPEPPAKKKTKKQEAAELAAAAAENQEPLLPYDADADGEDQGVDDDAEFSRRVDVEVFKDEPLTPSEWSAENSGIGLADGKIAYGDYLKRHQPYRWHAVAMNNKIISDGEHYFNLADLEETLELFAGDDTTVYASHMFGDDRGYKLLRYGKTDREHQAQQS